MKSKLLVFIAVTGLIAVYVFQRKLFLDPFQDFIYYPSLQNYPEFDNLSYVTGKVIRFLLNDAFSLLLIWGLFQNKSYLRFAIFVLLFGLLILLPIYLILVLNYYHKSFSFLNHLHRLVLNPVLMMLLIPAFYYQNKEKEKAKS